MSESINPNFKNDYKDFLHEYLLPLLGIDINSERNGSKDVLVEEKGKKRYENDPILEQLDGRLAFYISGYKAYSVECRIDIPEEELAIARRILQDFPNISRYKKTGQGRFLPIDFPYDLQKQSLYRTTIQNGIGCWLAGDAKNSKLELLFRELEMWSVKTYEGKNVTMGFLINPDAKSTFAAGEKKWLDFMHDDTAAMLTDCIHSVIELDAQCNFVAYHSLSEGDKVSAYELSYQTPLRFSQVIQSLVKNKKRGVFLLNNGDIVLAKDQKVRFVKRNLRWLNLSYRAFRNALQPFVDRSGCDDKNAAEYLEELLESVFASVLDVSFSHAGGIIAIATSSWGSEPILSSCDDLLHCAYQSEEDEHILILKRAVLESLINGEVFTKLDRKLRAELLGLDGACILKSDGRVQAFGSIIQNDSGSSGGGRGAAAKKLSKYGMAVKISTDGYIDVYVAGYLVYSIK